MFNFLEFSDIDIGVNLFCSEYKNPENIYLEAKENKIGLILTGSDICDSELAFSFAKVHNCLATAGIHPHNAQVLNQKSLKCLNHLLNQKEVVAIGECGLDYFRLFNSKELQKECFLAQLKLAKEINKPLFLHCRQAEEDFLEIFSAFKDLASRSVIHCYTSNIIHTRKFKDMGFKFGITGWLLDERRNSDLLASLAYLDLDDIMVETDAPYLTPRGFKLPYINKPSNLIYILQALAFYKNKELDYVRNKCFNNTLKFFNLS